MQKEANEKMIRELNEQIAVNKAHFDDTHRQLLQEKERIELESEEE